MYVRDETKKHYFSQEKSSGLDPLRREFDVFSHVKFLLPMALHCDYLKLAAVNFFRLINTHKL